MSRSLKVSCLITALFALVFACTARDEMKVDRTQLIARLKQEMSANTQWLRIHAAEGLLDNGESEKIAALFRLELATAAAPYRIAVWRVLARSTMGEEQHGYIERIREAMRDAEVTNRITAAESLGNLNAASRSDGTFVREWLKTADDATAAFPRWLLVLSSNP